MNATSINIKFHGSILLSASGESAVSGTPRSGDRLDVQVGNHFTACDIEAESNHIEHFSPGQEYAVTLSFPFGEYYKEYLRPGITSDLTFGAHKIGIVTIGAKIAPSASAGSSRAI